MPSIVFTYQVAEPTASNPTSLNLSKSAFDAAGNFLGVNIVSLGSEMVPSSIKSLLFQPATRSLTNTYAFINAPLDGVGTSFRVDRAYNGVQFAVQRANRSSSIFTCVTGVSAQTLVDNGFDSVSSEARRLWNLNG